MSGKFGIRYKDGTVDPIPLLEDIGGEPLAASKALFDKYAAMLDVPLKWPSDERVVRGQKPKVRPRRPAGSPQSKGG